MHLLSKACRSCCARLVMWNSTASLVITTSVQLLEFKTLEPPFECMEGHQARMNLALYLSLAGHHMNSFRESSSLSQTEVCTASLTQTDTDPPDILLTLFLTAHVGCYKLTFPNAPMTFFSGEQQTRKNQVCHAAAITKEYIRCKCCNCICSFLHKNSRRE